MPRARSFAADRAEVGVGTLIVFIAMVLVAAVAAAVIISTSGALQQRAQATGKEATENVASNLRLVAIYGNRNDTSSDLYDLHFQVSPAAGAVPIDLSRLLIRYTDGNRVITYNHSDAPLAEGSQGGLPQTWYNATWIRGAGTGAVAQSGDLVDIHLNLYSTSLPERESVEIVLLPETGEPVHANFISPSTYGIDLTVLLR